MLKSLVTVTENLGQANYKGFENDLAFVPFDGLTLTANYSYLDASTKSSVTALPFAPRTQYNLGAEYRIGSVGPALWQLFGSLGGNRSHWKPSSAPSRSLSVVVSMSAVRVSSFPGGVLECG